MKRYIVRGKSTKVTFDEVDTLKEAYEVVGKIEDKQKERRI